MTTESSLLLVHGRGFKPPHDAYLELSSAALCSGIERDRPDQVEAFNALRKDLAWYGDLNAAILAASGKHYDEKLDIGDRQNALLALREVTSRKKFGIRQYDKLPGKSAIPEFVASFVAPLSGAVGLGRMLIGRMAKDLADYFDPKSDMAMRARERVRNKLCALLERDGRVALLTHGMGSVIAYDVLWQLSHDPDFKSDCGDRKVDLWLTLGSPLGDAYVRKCLLGAGRKSTAQFPVNVISWHNVSAEDDYLCHDNTLADDFRPMMQQKVVSAVHDHKVFNHAVRYGKSNPHSSVGYYIHPRVTKILADWLASETLSGNSKYTP